MYILDYFYAYCIFENKYALKQRQTETSRYTYEHTKRTNPNPRSLLMKTSLVFPYLANRLTNCSSVISGGRLPTKRRQRWVKVFSPGFRKLAMSKTIFDGPPPVSSAAPSLCSSAGDDCCCCGGAGLPLFAGIDSVEAGDSDPRLPGCGELAPSILAWSIFRLAMQFISRLCKLNRT